MILLKVLAGVLFTISVFSFFGSLMLASCARDSNKNGKYAIHAFLLAAVSASLGVGLAIYVQSIPTVQPAAVADAASQPAYVVSIRPNSN